MTSKRIGLVMGGLLAGALLLGGAGLVAAQDPTETATPSPTAAGPGDMMGSMMSGQMGSMMSGQMGSMMSGQMGSMMSGQLEEMKELHDQMIESGVCDAAHMQAVHAPLDGNR